MPNRLLIILLLNFLSIHYLYSQKINVGIESGYHWYKMDDLKYVNDYKLTHLPFNPKITQEYPSYYNYSLNALYNFSPKIGAGLRYTFNSTGSRISTNDYSGKYIYDNTIKSNAISLLFEINVKQYNKLSINLQNDIGLIYSDLNSKEYLEIYEVYKDDKSFSYKSRNYFWDPSCQFKYPVYIFNIGVRLGYQIDFNKENLECEYSGVKLINQPNKIITSNWSGLHFNISASISFGYKK